MAPRKLTVGVLFDNVQAADIMGVDLLFNCSHEMVSAVSEVFKVPHLVADALFIECAPCHSRQSYRPSY